jgi:hypothetical protein
MEKKPSANIFGTFLSNINSAPSTSPVDLSQLTNKVLGWSEKSTSGPPPSPPSPPSSPARKASVIQTLLQTIFNAQKPLSIVDIVKSTTLDVDTVASALRDATATGLLSPEEQGDGSRRFKLTTDGQLMLASLSL